MRAFAVELLRFLATVWSRMWRWTLRKRRNLFITLGALALVLVITSTVFSAAPKPRGPQATPTPTPTSTIKYNEIQATPIAGEPGSTATPGTDDPATGTARIPTEPEVDRSSAESVARGWLTAYLTRPSDTWSDWDKWVEPYTMPKILEQVRGQAFQDPSVLAGKAPTTVSEIRVTEPEADAETSTPIRWSHNLDVDVKTADGSTLTITYGLVLGDSDDGWIVTSVSEVAVSGN